MPKSLYGFIWKVSSRDQILLCVITLVVAAMSMAPLELQRRIVNDAIENHDLRGKLVSVHGEMHRLRDEVEHGRVAATDLMDDLNDPSATGNGSGEVTEIKPLRSRR